MRNLRQRAEEEEREFRREREREREKVSEGIVMGMDQLQQNGFQVITFDDPFM